jgi:tRNA(Arg) A34 adenosine deaminase TadA
MNDRDFLRLALDQARESVKQGGFPAGAVVVKNGKVISKGVSLGFLLNDPTSHAETAAIRKACKILKTSNLEGATLYESLACCAMCFSVANWAGISRIVSGCRKTKDMVSKGYYEGKTDNNKLNKENNRRIELVFMPDFEKESLELIKEWENKNE